MLNNKKQLGDLLITKGLISQEEFESCLLESKESKKIIGQVLIDRNYVSEDQVYKVIAEQQGLEFIDLSDYPINFTLLEKFQISNLEKYGALPISEDDLYIIFALIDPLDLDACDALQRIYPKKMLQIVSANPTLIKRRLTQIKTNESIKGIISEIKQESFTSNKQDVSAVLQLIEAIIQSAVYAKASDIHIEPQEFGCSARFRIDGILTETFTFDSDVYPLLISRIKLLGGMDIAEKRKPQDGRFSMKIGAKEFDFRLSSLPTILGESIVARILDKSKVVLNLEDLGMPKNALRAFIKALKLPYGMVLVTGPTGSGKTTTLYAALNAVKSKSTKIITVENPVEYKMNLIQQVQVNEKSDLTFASALRSILRQDPDTIMIGEIRDAETLQIAVRAALTGHLVLSTLHTNDALSSLARIVDMGVEPYLVGPSLLAIEAQRLIRKLCPHCKEKYTPNEILMSKIEQFLPPEYQFYSAVGCNKCFGTGYVGREMVVEVLSVTDAISSAISKGILQHELEAIAKEEGFVSMFANGIEKAALGITTLEEVLRVTKA
jgi:general secretion pathway protein E